MTSTSTFRPDDDMPQMRVTFTNGITETYHTQTQTSDRAFKIVRMMPSFAMEDGSYETNVLVNISKTYVEPDDSYDGISTVNMLPLIGGFPVLSISDRPLDPEAHLEIEWDESTREVIHRVKWPLLEAVDTELEERTGRVRFINPACAQLCKAQKLVLHLPSAPEQVVVGIVTLLQLQTAVALSAVQFV